VRLLLFGGRTTVRNATSPGNIVAVLDGDQLDDFLTIA